MSHRRQADDMLPAHSSGKTEREVANDGYEFRQEVHSDDSPPADVATDADEPAGQQAGKLPEADAHESASRNAAADDRDPNWSIAHHYTCNRKLVQVRHCEPDDLFQLRQFTGAPRIALAGFLKRYGKSDWMKRQWLYVQMAAIAAAHEATHPLSCNGRDIMRVLRTEFDAIGFLNCGMRIKPRPGQPPFWICHQPEHCKLCNLWQRVKPAKSEFLPAFDGRKAWYSVTAMGRSNPAQAGIKLWLGEDADGEPIYDWLFRLTDHGQFLKLTKFGVDPSGIPNIVSEGLYRFMNWLTDGGYFDGLHAFRDISFTFFPDPGSVLEVSHTVNCHYHAYGNTSRLFTPNEARRMWFGCLRLLLAAGSGWPYAYPDIVLRPLPTVDALESAINYVIKPFRLADSYIKGLEHGCLLSGLNHEFHQTAFDAESLLFGPPQGYAFGNMAQKSRGHYIGVPPAKQMTRAQVERFLARLSTDEAHAWEYERHRKHLELLAKKRTPSKPRPEQH
jgi:hypothetical protein